VDREQWWGVVNELCKVVMALSRAEDQSGE
jgi:hypothetical protein